MKILLLTTDTPHHIFFVKEIAKSFEFSSIIVENSVLLPNFEVSHPFEDLRNEYEINNLLKNLNPNFDDFCKTISFNKINDKKCILYIKEQKPDVIISFGTGLINKQIINICPYGIINLHGGDPQSYRGLDSHLWAIYHKDFSQLIVTLHRLNDKLDDGEIISQAPIQIERHNHLYELRSLNTKVCVDLVNSSLAYFNKNGEFESKAQAKIGRYYSFMPSVLKEISLNNFNRYVKTI